MDASDRATASEMTVMTVILVLAASVTGWVAHGTWHFGDAWDYLTRTGGIQEILLQPHNGHLTVPAAAAYWTLRETVGVDFWPWYFLPRIAGYSAIAGSIWWVIRRRGAQPEWALLSGTAVAIMGASGFLTLAVLGGLIVFAAIWPLLDWIDRRPRPTGRQLAVVAIVMLLLLISTSSAIAFCLGMIGASLLSRHWRRWAAPPLAALVFYAGWYLKFGGANRPPGEWHRLDLLDLPTFVLQALGIAYRRFLGAPDTFGPILVVLALGIVLWAIAGDRVGYFEWSVLIALLIYIAMFVTIRVIPGHIAIGATRYGYVMVLMSLPLLVPLLPKTTKPRLRLATITVAAGLILLTNAGGLVAGLNYWEGKSRAARDAVVAASILIEDGEPHWPRQRINRDHARLAFEDAKRISTLVLRQKLPTDETTIRMVRHDMRVRWGSQHGDARGRLDILSPVGAEGCSTAQSGDVIELAGTGADAVRLHAGSRARVVVTTKDRFGLGHGSEMAPRQWLQVVPEIDEITLRIEVTEGNVKVCE